MTQAGVPTGIVPPAAGRAAGVTRTRLAVLGAVILGALAVATAVVLQPRDQDALPPCVAHGALECTTIDGFPIGNLASICQLDQVAVPTDRPDDCASVAGLTIPALDAREPGHPAVAGMAIYDYDMARVCGPVLCDFSGGHDIAVFDLVDGSHRAVGYACGVSGCFSVPAAGGRRGRRPVTGPSGPASQPVRQDGSGTEHSPRRASLPVASSWSRRPRICPIRQPSAWPGWRPRTDSNRRRQP